MSFGYARNSGIHALRDYGDALHKYESTTDIRGRKEEPKRPLGHRKSIDSYSIRKLENGDIECVCYRTPVVTFHTDNTISLVAGGWASQTTVNFINDVTGLMACVFDHSICVSTAPKGEYFRMDSQEPFKMAKDEHGYWRPVDVKKEFIHHIRRKESNIVIRKYAEVFEYLDRMRKLRQDGERAIFTKEEISQTFGDQSDGNLRRVDICLDTHLSSAPNLYTNFKSWIDDQSEDKHLSYYKVMLVLVNSVAWLDWHTEERRMKSVHWEEAKTRLKNMIWGYYRDQVFKPIEVQAGMVRRNTYGRFFGGTWDKYHDLTLLSTSETTQKNT